VVATDYPDLEIILADNASTDGSAEWVAEHFPSVRVVRHPENWAFCRGNNEAIPHTTGEFIVLLNNDVEVPAGWLHPLVEVMLSEPDVAAVGPKLLQYTRRDRFEYAGAAGGFLDRDGYPFARGRIFNTLESDLGQYDEPRDVFWISGAAIVLRRTALEKVGLLDEQFYMHMEEIDLCWRLKRAGFRIRSIPQSVAYHIGGSSLPKGDARKTYLNFRNNLLMLYKNLPPGVWRRTFARRVLLDGAAAVRALLTGSGGDASAIVRAYADAHRMSKAYRHSRPGASETPVLPPYRGSIVADYFLRGRRHFSDLPERLFR